MSNYDKLYQEFYKKFAADQKQASKTVTPQRFTDKYLNSFRSPKYKNSAYIEPYFELRDRAYAAANKNAPSVPDSASNTASSTSNDFDIEAVKRRIAAVRAKYPMPVDPPPPEQNPYSEYGRAVPRRAIPSPSQDNAAPATQRVVPRHAIPRPSQDNAAPATQRPVQKTVTRPAYNGAANTNTPATAPVPRAPQSAHPVRNIPTAPAVTTPTVPAASAAPVTTATRTAQAAPAPTRATQAAPTAKGQPDIQTLPNTNIQYRQYNANDPHVRKLKRRLRRMGFARFDENGPWIATPHGTDIMRELPQGLDKGVIQEMLAEGKVPVGVFDAASLAAQTAKAQAQAATASNVPYQSYQRANVPQQSIPQQPVPSTNSYSQRPTRRRRAFTRDEALRKRDERILKSIYKKRPFLAKIDEAKRKRKALEQERRRQRAEYNQTYYENLVRESALANDIINKHVPYNTDYKMTPEQQARWDFFKQNPKMFPFGDINYYYTKPTPLNASSPPPKSISQRFDDFYNYKLVPSYGDARHSIRKLLYKMNTPFREMKAIASQSTKPWYF